MPTRRKGIIAGGTVSLGLALSAAGCAAEFDSAATVDTLRVLGVQKDKPYAKPGEEVNLAALWIDANERRAGEVTFTWMAGCVNPAGDLYYLCFQDLDPSKAVIGTGNEFNFTIPKDIIKTHTPSKDPNVVPYGIAYVFFAACAGELKPLPMDTSGTTPTLPFGCFSKETGEQLTQKDFVAGYTAVYAYDKLTHKNPSISGFKTAPPPAADQEPAWKPITPDCIGLECVSEEPVGDPDEPAVEPECNDGTTICVPACEAQDDSCPTFPISPIITRPDPEPGERTVQGREQIWLAYLSNGATFTKDLTLVQDPNAGWIEDYSTEFMAPDEPGLVYIWAVVRDSLGGQNWVRIRVLAK